MRLSFFAGFAGLCLLASPATAQDAPVTAESAAFQPPAGAGYVFVGASQDKDGLTRATYVALPERLTAKGMAQVWVVNVFQTPMATTKGPAAYTSAAEVLDCDKGTVRTVRGGLFAADGTLLDSFASDEAPQPAPAGSMGYATGVVVCRDGAQGLETMPGLAAILPDAANHSAD